MKIFTFISTLMLTLASYAQLNISPTPVSGQIALTQANTYIYLSSATAQTVSLSLAGSGMTISSNRCTTIKANGSCYLIVAVSNYSTVSSPLSVALKNGSSTLVTLTVAPVAKPESSIFTTSSLQMDGFSNYSFTVQNKTQSTKSYVPVITGTDASKYSVVLNRCSSIVASGTCSVTIKLAPQLAGSYSATITEPQITGSLALSSTITNATPGAIQPPNPSITMTPSSQDFGTIANLGITAAKIFTVTNNGNVAVSPIVSVAGTGLEISLNRCLVLLSPTQSCTVSVVFNAVNSMTNGAQSGLSVSAQATSATPLLTSTLSATLNINSVLLNTSLSTSLAKTRVFMGEENICSLTNSGIFYCWGSKGPDASLILPSGGSYSPYNMNVFFPASAKPIKSVSLNAINYCVIGNNDLVYCDGYSNGSGSYGTGTTDSYDGSNPQQALMTGELAGKTVKKVVINNDTMCIIASNNLAYCSGNPYGLGRGDLVDSTVLLPVDRSGVLAGKTLIDIQVAYDGAFCAIANDGKVYCWGWGYEGLLGNGIEDISLIPVAVDWTGVLAGKTAKSLTERAEHTMCIIASDDKVYCWGDGYGGLLGDNSLSNSSVPVAVDWSGSLAGKKAKKLSGACLIADDNNVYCWSSYNGYIMNSSSRYPTLLDMSSIAPARPVSIITGNSSFCVESSDNKLYCWGGNDMAQLGQGYRDENFHPTPLLINFP